MSDKRRIPRIRRSESVSLALFHPAPGSSSECTLAATETIDVSQAGMRIYTDEPMDPDRIFDLCVEIGGQPQRYLLTGETKWCRYNDAKRMYEVGIGIRDGVDTDFSEWSASILTVLQTEEVEG